MDYDIEWDDALVLGAYNASWEVAPDFSMYTDDELLETPAHVLASKIREAAYDGRRLVIADPVATNDAVVRIPDIDRTPFDYTPSLTWAHAVDHPPLMRNYVNTDLANASIPPRVTEPELPDKTKLSTYEATAGEVALSAVEKCIVRGYSAIQAVQVAGGDADGLATVLNQAWGGVELFKTNFKADFLGDVSYTRYLARSTKRRFQLYRNIGWVVMVTAGANQASSSNYGENAIVNWQRRAELAAYYIHVAAMFEGQTLVRGTQFSITARIPSYAVQYGAWDECAMAFDPDELPSQRVPAMFQLIAEELTKSRLSTFLYAVSAIVRQASEGTTFDIADDVLRLASKYDKLVFVEPFRVIMSAKEPSINRKADLVFGRHESRVYGAPIMAKSNDPATAVIEAIMMDSKHKLTASLASVSAHLLEMTKIAPQLDKKAKLKLVEHVSTYLSSFNDICAIIVNSFELNERGKIKKNWDKMMKHNIPWEIVASKNPATVLRNVTAFALIMMDGSKAVQTTKYWASKVTEMLSIGIRGKKHMLIDKGGDVQVAIMQDIASATAKTYNARYRSRATAYVAAADCTDDRTMKKKFTFYQAYWYLRADMTQSIVPKIKNGSISLDVNVPFVKKAMITAASKLGKLVSSEPPLVQKLTTNDTSVVLDDWLEKVEPAKWLENKHFFRKSVEDFQRYLDVHRADFDIAAEAILQPVPDESPADLHEPKPEVQISKLVENFADFKYSPDALDIEGTINHLVEVAELEGALDPDDIDAVCDRWRKIFNQDDKRTAAFVTKYMEITDKDKAEDLLVKWIEKVNEKPLGNKVDIA